MKLGDVPCNGCTACCEHDAVYLYPGRGDDPGLYETVVSWNPVAKTMMPRLKSRSQGGCIYLDDDGCTIHDRRPQVCRTFDCRDIYRKTTRVQRKHLVKNGVADKRIFDAGRARLDTLSLTA